MLIIAELLTTQYLLPEELDVLGRVKSPGDGSLYRRASHLRRTNGLHEKNVLRDPKELSPEKVSFHCKIFSSSNVLIRLDDIKTKEKKETLIDMVVLSLGGAYELVTKSYGFNSENWKWGDAHFLTHKHTFSKVKIVDYLLSLSVGPYRSGGSSLTPNAGGYKYGESFAQTSGASMRRVVDFSDMNNTQMIIPTGQSGNVKSVHYRDQAELYHNGGYRKTMFDLDHIKADNTVRHLVLVP